VISRLSISATLQEASYPNFLWISSMGSAGAYSYLVLILRATSVIAVLVEYSCFGNMEINGFAQLHNAMEGGLMTYQSECDHILSYHILWYQIIHIHIIACHIISGSNQIISYQYNVMNYESWIKNDAWIMNHKFISYHVTRWHFISWHNDLTHSDTSLHTTRVLKKQAK